MDDRFYRYSNAGYYIPSFLTIYSKSSEDYSNLIFGPQMSPFAEATFLHEYIHFLQDMTTITGLGNICVVVDYMKRITNKTKEGKIKVPYLPKPQDKQNLYQNNKLKQISTGSGGIKIEHKTTNRIYLKEEDVYVKGKFIKQELTAILEYTNIFDIKQEYRIGEHCISESMAHIIENILYPNVISTPSLFPYGVVKLVCDHIAPGFSDDPLRMVALCDACLCLSFPGKTMVKALWKLKDIYHTKTPEKIYAYITSREFIDYAIEGNNKSFLEHFLYFHEQAKKQIIGYFTTHNYLNMIKWVNQMFDESLKFRISTLFFLDICRGKNIRNNWRFRDVLGNIGCPVIMNNKHELTYIRNNNINFEVYPPVFNAIEQIYSIFSKDGVLDKHGFYECKLKDWCSKDFQANNKIDITVPRDSPCRYAPWENFKINLQCCYFSQIWFTWGLKDLIPIPK